MKIAKSRTVTQTHNNHLAPWTYFGDGEWDQKACAALGFNFILVGNRFKSQPQLDHFQPIDEVIDAINYHHQSNSQRYANTQ